jgi:hypothetical protein
MSEILCTNDKFTGEQLEFFKIHGVVTPKVDTIYSIRQISKQSNGRTGILLNEIINEPVPVKHRILGLIYREVDWDVNRFAKLNGDAISKEEIKEMLKILA